VLSIYLLSDRPFLLEESLNRIDLSDLVDVALVEVVAADLAETLLTSLDFDGRPYGSQPCEASSKRDRFSHPSLHGFMLSDLKLVSTVIFGIYLQFMKLTIDNVPTDRYTPSFDLILKEQFKC
jgi:hypothetical protein